MVRSTVYCGTLDHVLIGPRATLADTLLHSWEENHLRSNDLGRHTGLGSVDEAVASKSVDLDGHLVGNELAGLLAGQSVSCDDGGGVDLVFDQLVGSLEELGSNDHDRGGAVTDFLVLLLGQLDKNSSCRMLHLQHVENSGTIVGDGDILLIGQRKE